MDVQFAEYGASGLFGGANVGYADGTTGAARVGASASTDAGEVRGTEVQHDLDVVFVFHAWDRCCCAVLCCVVLSCTPMLCCTLSCLTPCAN
jgi:hypothetical protein